MNAKISTDIFAAVTIPLKCRFQNYVLVNGKRKKNSISTIKILNYHYLEKCFAVLNLRRKIIMYINIFKSIYYLLTIALQ